MNYRQVGKRPFNHFSGGLFLLCVGVSLMSSMAACAPVTQTALPETVNPGPYYTQAAQTIAVKLTSRAPTPLTGSTTPPSNTSTLTPTLEPSPTTVPPVELTAETTVSPTVPSSSTPTYVRCNQAEFLGDLSAQAGDDLFPEQEFVKTYLIQNTGQCSWTIDYMIQFVSGERMGTQQSFAFTNTVEPGETTTLNLILIAPFTAGVHRSGWLLNSNQGELFGTRGDQDELLWVEIRVIEPPPA